MRSPYIKCDLLDLETRIRDKIDSLIKESKGMLPIERIKKGRQMQALSRSIRLLIEQELEDEAEILLDLLQDLGADLPGR